MVSDTTRRARGSGRCRETRGYLIWVREAGSPSPYGDLRAGGIGTERQEDDDSNPQPDHPQPLQQRADLTVVHRQARAEAPSKEYSAAGQEGVRPGWTRGTTQA